MAKDPLSGGFGSSPLGLARFILHLPNFFKLYWRLFTDRRVSLLPKIILVLGVAYLLVPSDILFDFLPLPPLGLFDDTVVLIVAAKGFMALCPRRIVEEHVRLIDEGS